MDEQERRSTLYAFTSRLLLQEVDAKLLNTIKNDKNLLELLPNVSKWELFNSISDEELINSHLNVDFTNISLLHLTPYETFYTRDDGMVESGGANPVTNTFHAYDFKVEFSKARVVSPDHIGVELEFMHHLIEAQIKAEKSGDMKASREMQIVERNFLENHMLRWAPMYLISVKFESRIPFYHDVSDLTLEFLLSDYEYLQSELKA